MDHTPNARQGDSSMNFEKLRLLRAAGRVERMHVQPTARQQTVGEHTYGVLCLIDFVAPEMTMKLWRAALYHDAPEAITGDVPATAKWRFPHLNRSLDIVEVRIKEDCDLDIDLSDKEYTVLKFCDTMELVLFSIEEAERGDKNTIRVIWNCFRFLSTNKHIYEVTEKAKDLYQYVYGYAFKHYPDEGVLFNEGERQADLRYTLQENADRTLGSGGNF